LRARKTGPGSAGRRGRPPGTSARELEVVALRLSTEHGFDDTIVEDTAHKSGVSRRTFFRYFDSTADARWHAVDREVATLRATFQQGRAHRRAISPRKGGHA
jgi:TetR/AcrR family transcriptional regulator, regulator of mycofactocin system